MSRSAAATLSRVIAFVSAKHAAETNPPIQITTNFFRFITKSRLKTPESKARSNASIPGRRHAERLPSHIDETDDHFLWELVAGAAALVSELAGTTSEIGIRRRRYNRQLAVLRNNVPAL